MTPERFRVRLAGPADVPAIAALMERSVRELQRLPDPERLGPEAAHAIRPPHRMRTGAPSASSR